MTKSESNSTFLMKMHNSQVDKLRFINSIFQTCFNYQILIMMRGNFNPKTNLMGQ